MDNEIKERYVTKRFVLTEQFLIEDRKVKGLQYTLKILGPSSTVGDYALDKLFNKKCCCSCNVGKYPRNSFERFWRRFFNRIKLQF